VFSPSIRWDLSLYFFKAKAEGFIFRYVGFQEKMAWYYIQAGGLQRRKKIVPARPHLALSPFLSFYLLVLTAKYIHKVKSTI
jgi:hypothetical protein